MKRLKAYIPALSVFALALLVRVVYNLTSARGYVPLDDAALYNNLGYAIVYQHCFCEYLKQPYLALGRPPLWPYILSIIYRLTPQPSLSTVDSDIQVFYARMLLSVVGSCTCVLVYLLARDFFGKRIGLITGCMAAVYVGLFIYDGWIYTESLYIFLFTAFVYTLYRLQCTKQWRWALLGGIALALAALTRPNGPVLFGLLALWGIVIVLAKGVPWKTVAKSGLAITGIALILIAPWTYRNYQVSHSFILVSLGSGDALLGVYNDTVLSGVYNDTVAKGKTGLWVSGYGIVPHPNLPAIVLAGHDAPNYTPEDDRIATDYALTWIRHHWRAMPKLLGEHLLMMWTPFTAENALPFRVFSDRLSSQIIWFMIQYIPIPIFLLALFGLIVTWRSRKQQLIVVYVSIALTIAENIAFYGNMRFRAPIEPLLLLLVGGVIWWFTSAEPGTLRSQKKQRQRSNSLDAPVPAENLSV